MWFFYPRSLPQLKADYHIVWGSPEPDVVDPHVESTPHRPANGDVLIEALRHTPVAVLEVNAGDVKPLRIVTSDRHRMKVLHHAFHDRTGVDRPRRPISARGGRCDGPHADERNADRPTSTSRIEAAP